MDKNDKKKSEPILISLMRNPFFLIVLFGMVLGTGFAGFYFEKSMKSKISEQDFLLMRNAIVKLEENQNEIKNEIAELIIEIRQLEKDFAKSKTLQNKNGKSPISNEQWDEFIEILKNINNKLSEPKKN